MLRYALVFLILINVAYTDIYIEEREVEKWSKKSRLAMLLLSTDQCAACANAETVWKHLEDIFDDFVDFKVLKVGPSSAPENTLAKYPGVRVFQKGSITISYTKSITVEDVTSYVLGLLEKSVKDSYARKGFKPRDSFVVTLAGENFTSTVQNSDEHYLVEFFAPWCGHCKALEQPWKEAAKLLHGRMNLAAVDATVHKELASRFDVKGFPTIKFFPAHTKNLDSGVSDYSGGRSASDIVSWAEAKLAALKPPPELHQLAENSQLVDGCLAKSICVLAFLPNRIDTTANQWTNYIDQLRLVINYFKSNGWGWFWLEGGVQDVLEEALGVGGFGYPTVVALNFNKKAYSVMKKAYSESNVKAFLYSLGSRSITTERLTRAMPDLKKTDKWDGADFQKYDL